LRSMTGFGAADAGLGRGKLVVEVRATNHRFLDVRVRLPHPLADLVGFAEATLRERLVRGRFDLTAHLDGAALGAPTLDKERARAAFRALTELRDELAPGQEVPLSLLASVPGIFAPPLEGHVDEAKAAVLAATTGALAAMDTMRDTEGAALARDLGARLAHVRQSLELVRARAPELAVLHRRRLMEKVERLALTGDLGPGGVRVEQEIALFADRVDVTEELTRMSSHLDQSAALLTSPEPVGRRLDFLLQEMMRETSTIGAKSPDTAISHAVVEIKAEIERMREQVQNVE
jgi:uncharacterized protein (TIGR00255 family)